MSKFNFKTDQQSEKYCLSIANIMVEKFNITEEEALGRINRRWKNISFIGEDNMIYHELEEFWAFDIYFGSDSHWWKEEISNITPIPYP